MKKINITALCVLLMTAFHLQAAFTPENGAKYYIVQELGNSQHVLGAVGTQPTVSNAEYVNSQLFEFISTGTADTYYIQNADGLYLNKSTADGWTTIYEAATNGANSEWVIYGDNFNDIRLKVNASGYLASDAIVSGSTLYCDKTNSNANGKFKLVKASDIYQNGIIDGSFEYATSGGAPMGTWISDPSQILGTGYTTASRSRVNNTGGHATSGNNYFYLTFRQPDKNGYNAISTKVGGLIVGATYQFSFSYNQDGADDHLADVYAATTANVAVGQAIDNAVYTTSLDAKTSVQTGIFSFLAPSESVYIVFRNQQGGVSTEFNLYIDGLSLVKTADPQPEILTSVSSLSFDSYNRNAKLTVTGALLTDSIEITAPSGITLSSAKFGANAKDTVLFVSFSGFDPVTGDIVFSSGSTTKNVAVSAIYNAPTLTGKKLSIVGGDVAGALTVPVNITSATDTRDITKLVVPTLPEQYTIEVKARVNSSDGRGLDIEARNAEKSGFRVAANTAAVVDYSQSNVPVALKTKSTIETDYHVYRYAVDGNNVHLFIDNEYTVTLPLEVGMKPNNLIDNGGFEENTLEGWTNPTGWGRDITDARAYSGNYSLNLAAWHGSVLVTQYLTPLSTGDYEFKFQYIKHTGNNYRWGLSLDNNETFLNGQWNNLNQTTWTSQTHSFNVAEAGTLTASFWEWNNGAAITIDNVELIEAENETITPYISFGKAFGKGAADIDIEYVNYDLSGAYEPENIGTYVDEKTQSDNSIFYANGYLIVKNANNERLDIYSVSGTLLESHVVNGNLNLPVNFASGVYIAKMRARTIKFVK